MSKQWWSSRTGFTVQGACLLVLFVWSVAHRAPVGGAARTPAEPAAVIDNSEDNSVADNTADGSETDARFVAPPTVRFRTENPPAGSLNPRPVEVSEPEPEQHAAPWQPVHPQNPPRRVPGGGKDGTRSPFEVSGNGATVYNAPPPDAD